MLDELALELHAITVSYLDSSELTKYVTVSRPWQHAFERRRFRNIHLESTDLLAFSNTLLDHRRAALTELSSDIILPAYSDRQCAGFKRENDKQANNEALTEAVHRPFSVLRS
jgi:hypothetical protein